MKEHKRYLLGAGPNSPALFFVKDLAYTEDGEIGVKGAEYIGKGQWPELKHLSLSYNEIKGRGALKLVRGKWAKL